MGEARKDALRLEFDHRLRLEFHGTKVTSDAGLLAYRELDETLSLTSTIDSELRGIRTGKNTQHGLAALLRQSIYSRLAGYDDTNDAERLCVDPAMRHIAGGRAIERSAASTSAMGRFETEVLTQSKNLELLMNLAGEWVDRVHRRKSLKQIILYHSFRYQAASWNIARRVVAKIEWHVGELFPRVGFIVTNLRFKSSNVVKFYNKRGTDEQWIKEGKYALNWTRLSCHDFVDNQVRLQLFALAYNLGNFLRRLALPKSVKKWSLTTLRDKLIKIGAKVIRHSRYVIFQMAEVMVSKRLFQEILERIRRLKPVRLGYG